MSGQYSHRQFFRRMPNEFLERYFASEGIDLGADFKALKKADAVARKLRAQSS